MRVVWSLLALVSINSFADCPNLANKYSCVNDKGGKESHVVSQSITNGITTYVLDNNWTIPADGQGYPYSADGGLKNGLFHASCDQNGILKIDVSGQVYWGRAYKGDLTTNTTVRLTDNNMNIDVDSVFKPVDNSDDRRASMIEVCTP